MRKRDAARALCRAATGVAGCLAFLSLFFVGWLKIGQLSRPEQVMPAISPIEMPCSVAENAVVQKPYLWVYWENVNGNPTPGYISLCRKAMHKHCDNSFNVVELDNHKIYDYLPELRQVESNPENKFSRLSIAQRVDYYRIALLEKYGGLYIDADMLVMQDLKPLIDKLEKYDFVGWGAFHPDYYSKPQNGLMASRPHGVLMSNLLRNINKHVLKKDTLDYFDLGRNIIELTLTTLINTIGYEYYHFAGPNDGLKDKNGEVVFMDRMFSDQPTEYADMQNLLMITLYNAEITNAEIENKQPLGSVKKMTEEQLLAQNTNFTKFMRMSLGL